MQTKSKCQPTDEVSLSVLPSLIGSPSLLRAIFTGWYVYSKQGEGAEGQGGKTVNPRLLNNPGTYCWGQAKSLRCYNLFIWLFLYHREGSAATRLPQICHTVWQRQFWEGPRPHSCLFYPSPGKPTRVFIFKVFLININQWRLWHNSVGWEAAVVHWSSEYMWSGKKPRWVVSFGPKRSWTSSGKVNEGDRKSILSRDRSKFIKSIPLSLGSRLN